MIGSGMEDAIAEPRRESLVPGYRAVKSAALAAKASGVAISGAGPSIVALVDRTRGDTQRIGRIMVKEFSRNRTRSEFFITNPGRGARIIQS
jgi:homoserine kinase